MASGRKSGSVCSYFRLDESNYTVHCKECKQELAYNKNTNAMREHLKRKHVHVNLQKNDERCVCRKSSSLPVGLSLYYNCHLHAHVSLY